MALEFSIGDICEKAEEGDPIAFSGEILKVNEPEDKGEGKWGQWIQQTIKVGEGQARIQYDRNVEKGDTIFTAAQEGERVRIKGAKFRRWNYKGKTYYAASGGEVLEPELTELYRGSAGGDGDKGDEHGSKSTPHKKKIAPHYEDVARGAAVLMRDILGVSPVGPLEGEVAAAVERGVVTAIIRAGDSTGLDMSRLVARGQSESLRRRKEAGEPEPEEEPPQADAEKTAAEQAEEDRRTVTQAERIALDDLRVKYDVPKESLGAQAVQRWGLKNPALMNRGQMRVLAEWIEGKEKKEDSANFPF